MRKHKVKFNALIPELSVSKIEKSLEFYIKILGFKVEYERPADRFAFLSIEEAQVMIEEVNHHWDTAKLEYPFGRGLNLQIEVSDVSKIIERLHSSGHPLFRPLQEKWYQTGEVLEGVTEFLVQDPDGYLLRFTQYLGTKPLP